jgi:GNAT superfamily N-acetyltransferase
MLAALMARTFRDAFAALNTADNLARHEATHYRADVQRAELLDPTTTTLIAEVNGVAAGYAQITNRPPPPELPDLGGLNLSRFYLEQAWVGRGVAQPLMTAVREVATARGATSLWLTAWELNPRAAAFYRKCGFTEVGRTTFLVGADAQTDWVMVLPLRP